KIPLLDVTKKMCGVLGIDPYRLIGSGSMLITTSNTHAMMDELSIRGIKATVIGKITENGLRLIDKGVATNLTMPQADELFSI
ncbi:MAG: AIR synthase, partial [Eubacteriales bacterium]|nr:AIR synthase [Eubacteriales bacterium]